MHIPFWRLIVVAKKQTGYNFPTPDRLRNAFLEGEAMAMLHKVVVTEVQGYPEDTMILDSDDAHYMAEDIITEACVTMYRDRKASMSH